MSKKQSRKFLNKIRGLTLQMMVTRSAEGNHARARWLFEACDRESQNWIKRTTEDWERILVLDGEVYINKATFEIGNRAKESVRTSPDFVHITVAEIQADSNVVMKKLADR